MIDWNEAQILYDQLMEFRGKIAWLQMKDPALCRIRDDICKVLGCQLITFEAYLATNREKKTEDQ